MSGAQPVAEAGPVEPIDPFAPLCGGVYRDGVVEVAAVGEPRPRRRLHTVRTRHFDVTHVGSRIRVEHAVPTDRVDDDLSGLLAEELFGPGWLRGPETFERLFTGVVRTSAPDPVGSWELFYRNTLRRVADVLGGAGDGAGAEAEAGAGVGDEAPAHGTIAGYAPVYGHAERLLAPGSALELGCCFGFLSLHLAAAGRRVLASDLSPGTVAVLEAVAPRLGLPLSTRVADAARFPGRDACADTVLALHLLEHLDHEHGDRVVVEALRLARRRVVVAVPLEDEPDETWGHVRTVSLDDLHAWGRASGRPYDVHEHHGGWLVVDTS